MTLPNSVSHCYNHRLDENIHSPIDIYISKSIYKILPYVIEQKITENHIYFISLILSFITSFLIEKNIKYIPGITLMLSYYFNVMYFIYIEYKRTDEDANIISVQETTLNIITVSFIMYSLYKKNIHGYIIVTILSIGLLCNFGCQIQYFKQKYPDKKLPFIFTKIFTVTCPVGTCSKYLNFKEKSSNFDEQKNGLKLNNSLNSYLYDSEKSIELKTQFNKLFINLENIKNKINTKYMGSGTVFLVMSLYLSFI